MKVDWLTPFEARDPNEVLASVWIRCIQLLPYLEERGISNLYNEVRDDADVAVFVRWQDEKAQQLAMELNASDTKVVFDLCVNYFDESSAPYLDEDPVTERHVQECLAMADFADAVTCASQFIAERASQHHPNAVALPDSVDPRHFEGVKDGRDFERDSLRVVWNGSSHKAQELRPILPLLDERDLDLVVVSDNEPKLPFKKWFPPKRYGYEFRRWRYDTFPRELVRGDICVSPRQVDTPYNRGHSSFKIAVAMAQGVPALAGPVPSYKRVLKSGGGRICRTTDDWARALDRALEDRSRLKRWSREARKAVESLGTGVIADRYVDLFEELAA